MPRGQQTFYDKDDPAYQAGINAACAGDNIDECPYHHLSRQGRIWRHAWKETMAEKGNNDGV